MKKSLIILLLVTAIIILACQQETYLTCPDNVTQVLDLTTCPQPRPSCPDCDDSNNCTIGSCSAATNYECVFSDVTPCDGNGKCEEGEFPWSKDCPKTCDDGEKCTEDTFNYFEGRCLNEEIIPCCGNLECETGETFFDCPQDCDQLLEIRVDAYRKTEKIGNVEVSLISTDHTYLIVEFKIHNILIDGVEELNFKKEKGFYYDPYKFRALDSDGNFYNVEYDSDLLANWRYYDIVPKGGTVSAALLFIIPKSVESIRLIAYDKYGRRLDASDIF